MTLTQARLIEHYRAARAETTDEREKERQTGLLRSALELALVYAEGDERAEIISELESL